MCPACNYNRTRAALRRNTTLLSRAAGVLIVVMRLSRQKISSLLAKDAPRKGGQGIDAV